MHPKTSKLEQPKFLVINSSKQNLRKFSVVLFLCILYAFYLSLLQMETYATQHKLSFFAETVRLRLAMAVNSELAVAQHMADTPTIQHYLQNPYDLILKEASFEKFAVFRRHFKHNSIFWISDINKQFYINDGMNPYPLDPALPENYWYNLTLRDTPEYNFNINYNPNLKQVNLWLNVPVFAERADGTREAVGMVGTGIDLHDFKKFIYRQQDSGYTLHMFNAANEITFADNFQMVFDKTHIKHIFGEMTDRILNLARNKDEEIQIFIHNSTMYAVCSVDLAGWTIVASITLSSLPSHMENGIVAGSLLIIMLLIIALNIFAARVRKAFDSVENSNRIKTTFLARMSHEIRTPMNVIIGMSELAQRDYGTSRALAYINGIRSAGTTLLAIINDILDFSKIESGNMQIAQVPYETAALFTNALTVIRVRMAEKPIKLIADIAPSIPTSMVGDSTRVQQILLNLLSNAIKYTEQGFVKISATGERVSDKEIRLTFNVEDSGIGIRAKDLPNLFTDFVRLEENKHHNIEGTGLGLTITRSLCQEMGGAVTVQSEYGKGSIFTATLLQKVTDWTPMGDITAQTANNLESGSIDFIAPKTNAQKINYLEKGNVTFTAPEAKVLVVDDMPSNLLVAEGLLAPYGMRVFTCLSGQEAVNMAQDQPFDLIFMDHMMPDMDGVEATKRIRALVGERFKKLPIIALTANAVSGMMEMFLENGFDDFLSKPINSSTLNAILEKWIPKEKYRVTPADKKNGPEPEKTAPEKTGAVVLPEIDGLDMAAGIAVVNGSPAQYHNLLEMFCRDARERLPKLSVKLPVAPSPEENA